MTPSTKPASPVPLFQQQPSPPSSSVARGGIIQRVNPGSHEDMGNCQQVTCDAYVVKISNVHSKINQYLIVYCFILIDSYIKILIL